MTEPTTYAIAWDGDGARLVGYAQLLPAALRLEGRDADGREELRTIGYREITNVHIERRNGHRTITLDLSHAQRLMIHSLDRPGSLGELADRLRRLTDSPHD